VGWLHQRVRHLWGVHRAAVHGAGGSGRAAAGVAPVPKFSLLTPSTGAANPHGHHKLVHSFRHRICGQLQGKSKRPSRRTLKRLPQDIRHQLEQLQVPPELLANPKVTVIETDECSCQEAPLDAMRLPLVA
jgi:hypothetical protein